MDDQAPAVYEIRLRGLLATGVLTAFPRLLARAQEAQTVLSGSRQVVGRGRLELALFAAVYALYDAARWVFAGRPAVAQTHARSVLHLERTLHLAIEGSVQRAFAWPVASWVLANVYLAAQLAVLPAALVLLYHRSPAVYRQLRNTVVVAWLIAIPIFAIYPVAPPRLAGIGIRDTVSHQAAVALTGHSTMFYNPYAAVPSLHVGLAFAVGVAVAMSCDRRWVKALALAWGPLVTLAVVATGNHFIFDAIAGLFVTAVACGLSQGLARTPTRVPAPVGRRAGALTASVSHRLQWPAHPAAQKRPAH